MGGYPNQMKKRAGQSEWKKKENSKYEKVKNEREKVKFVGENV